MNLGEDTVQALAWCNTSQAPSNCSEAQLDVLGKAVLAVLTGEQKEEEALADSSLQDIEVNVLKQLYAGLVCTFLEAAKMGLLQSELKHNLLHNHNFTELRADSLSQSYGQHKSALREVLARSANHSHIPCLTKVAWRFDYCLATSNNRSKKDPLYHIALHTTMRHKVQKTERINFVCDVHQLQDMVTRLRDACISVERTLLSFEKS